MFEENWFLPDERSDREPVLAPLHSQTFALPGFSDTIKATYSIPKTITTAF